MDDADSRTLWVLYHTGCWHAWSEEFGRSVCGLVRQGPATGERVRDVRRRPPDRRVCRVCRRRMAQSHSRVHRDGPACGCHPCRAERRRRARERVRGVRVEVHRQTCACIRRVARSGEGPWRSIGAFLDEAERVLASRLLIWEVTGEEEADHEAAQARDRLLACWRSAARYFERRDGEHTCRIGRP